MMWCMTASSHTAHVVAIFHIAAETQRAAGGDAVGAAEVPASLGGLAAYMGENGAQALVQQVDADRDDRRAAGNARRATPVRGLEEAAFRAG